MGVEQPLLDNDLENIQVVVQKLLDQIQIEQDSFEKVVIHRFSVDGVHICLAQIELKIEVDVHRPLVIPCESAFLIPPLEIPAERKLSEQGERAGGIHVDKTARFSAQCVIRLSNIH